MRRILLLLVFTALATVALLMSTSCSGEESPIVTSGGTVEPTATRGPTPTAAPSPTPRPRFSGFDFEIGEGTWWEYRWEYSRRSCAQGSGCSTKSDTGTFRVALGSSKTIQGVKAYEMRLSGKHQVALPNVSRDFAPRWRYLAVSDHQVLGSNGATLTTLFDGKSGKWAGSGYFTDRFDSSELVRGRSAEIKADSAIASWPGVRTGPMVLVSRASSQSKCEVIVGIRVCPRKQSFTATEQEYYRAGVAPMGYYYHITSSFSGGGFSSSVQSREDVALVASSLRGDSITGYELESEPNDTLERAQSLTIPALVRGSAHMAHPGVELRWYDDGQQKFQSFEMEDLYTFRVDEQRAVSLELNFRAALQGRDLNLILLTLSETNQVSNVTVGGEPGELVELSIKRDARETIIVTLNPGVYWVGIQAFSSVEAIDYVLKIEFVPSPGSKIPAE